MEVKMTFNKLPSIFNQLRPFSVGFDNLFNHFESMLDGDEYFCTNHEHFPFYNLVKTGDKIKIDLNKRRIDLLISDKEIENRKRNTKIPELDNQTPWQEISRSLVGQLETGACLETKSIYFDITNTKGMPRNSH